MKQQITNTILMIRPVRFRMNEQTAVNNYFMEDTALRDADVNSRAQQEFDAFVKVLEGIGIHVIVVEDKFDPDTPDSIFPNNWISFHASGTVVLYPMFAVNRRKERREDILDLLEEKGYQINQVIDYSPAERDELFLEGTGSVVMDRVNQKVYCALSARAHEALILEFCEDFHCTPVIFTAYQSLEDGSRLPIYHTNVMMCIADQYAVICLDTIDDMEERQNVVQHLQSDGKEIVEITEVQMNHFAGNMLQVSGKNGQKHLVMSSAAYSSLRPEQLETLMKYNPIVHSSLDTIEQCGGGSARCMMAEIFLPQTVGPNQD
ncbi:MAG: arginine deiminase-related protein [Flavobacteriaceae bacterium]